MLKRWRKSKKLMEGMNYTEVLTTRPTEAIEIAKNEMPNYDGIIAVGGDGTVNEVVNGLLATPENQKRHLLGMVPIGTGNDLANTMQIHLSVERAIETLKDGIPTKVDVGVVEGSDFHGNTVRRYFLGVASFGFDAEVANDTAHGRKWLPGTWNYFSSTIKNLIWIKKRAFEIEVDGGSETIREEAFFLAIGNGKFYGAGMMICPDADVYDGIFNCTFVRPVSRFKFLRVFPKVYTGEHRHHPAVRMFSGRSFAIKTDKKTLYQVDGEVLGNLPATVKGLNLGINIMLPRDKPDFFLKRKPKMVKGDPIAP